jgi:transposase
VKDACDEFLYKMHLRPRGEEKKQLEEGILKKARRWVVERTASWLNRFRGILIRWCKKADNYLALLHFACGIIVWRAALCG